MIHKNISIKQFDRPAHSTATVLVPYIYAKCLSVTP